jgi:hypothetical protein
LTPSTIPAGTGLAWRTGATRPGLELKEGDCGLGFSDAVAATNELNAQISQREKQLESLLEAETPLIECVVVVVSVHQVPLSRTSPNV